MIIIAAVIIIVIIISGRAARIIEDSPDVYMCALYGELCFPRSF